MQEFLHVKPGKGSAFVRSKLKNLETGNTLEKTWKAGESFADAQVDKEEMQYSYMDGARVDPHPLSHRQSPFSCPAPHILSLLRHLLRRRPRLRRLGHRQLWPRPLGRISAISRL